MHSALLVLDQLVLVVTDRRTGSISLSARMPLRCSDDIRILGPGLSKREMWLASLASGPKGLLPCS